MKYENTEKFLKKVGQTICDKCKFSFEIIGHNSPLDYKTIFEVKMSYNDTGNCKFIIDEHTLNAHGYILQIMSHKNCQGFKVPDIFWALPDEIEEANRLIDISETVAKLSQFYPATVEKVTIDQLLTQIGANEPTNEPYMITDEPVYFDYHFRQRTFEEYLKNRSDMQRGRIVLVSKYPDVQIVKHRRLDGSTVSLLYGNELFEFDDLQPGGDEILKAIELIDTKGLETILNMAKAA